jgi:ribosomal protein L37AE/L43A
MNKNHIGTKRRYLNGGFVRDRGTYYGQAYRKTYCPNCFTHLSDNIIRLRDGLYQCRRCNALWTKD